MIGMPKIIATIESIQQYTNGALSAIRTGAGIYNKMISSKALESGASYGQIWNAFISSVIRIKPSIAETDMAATTTMYNLMNQVNELQSSVSSGIPIRSPEVLYLLKPIDGGVSSLLGTVATKFIRSYPNLDLGSWANRIPVHGYVIVNYYTDNTTRKAIVMSVGAVKISPDLLDGILADNFVEYIVWEQSLDENGLTWHNVSVIEKSDRANSDTFFTDLSISSIAETYEVNLPYSAVLTFVKRMEQSENRYRLLTNNCQHMSKRMINFIVKGIHPNWWKDEFSLEIVIAVLTSGFVLNSHQTIRPDQIKEMLNKNMDGTAPISMYTYYLDLFESNVDGWLTILS